MLALVRCQQGVAATQGPLSPSMQVISTAFLAGGRGLSPSLKLATNASLARVKSAWFTAMSGVLQSGYGMESEAYRNNSLKGKPGVIQGAFQRALQANGRSVRSTQQAARRANLLHHQLCTFE